MAGVVSPSKWRRAGRAGPQSEDTAGGSAQPVRRPGGQGGDAPHANRADGTHASRHRLPAATGGGLGADAKDFGFLAATSLTGTTPGYSHRSLSGSARQYRAAAC
jgi:hypothetical protein